MASAKHDLKFRHNREYNMKSTHKKKSKSISEEVAHLLLNPGESSREEDSSSGNEAPRVSEFDEYALPNAQSTEFRKRNVILLSEQSERYKGKISSRKILEVEDNSKNNISDSEKEDASDVLAKFDAALNGHSESIEDDSHSSRSEDEDSEEMGDCEDDVEDEETDQSNLMIERNREAEKQKGASVQNQLRIWEKLLELRIQSQKCLSSANQLPSPEIYEQLRNESQRLQQSVEQCAASTSVLLKSLLHLQDALYNQYAELKQAIKRKATKLLNNDDEVDVPTKRFNLQLEQNFTDFRAYRNSVLLKWDDRTKLLTTGTGSKKKTLNEEYGIVCKIDNALLNRRALIVNSQKQADNGTGMSYKKETTNLSDSHTDVACINVHTYDDNDFYHQQLRELIEHKVNTSSTLSDVTRRYVDLQKLRQKMKKPVDTRASKGRKLRYIVHKKMVNFMAPNDDIHKWTDDASSELYKSLFIA